MHEVLAGLPEYLPADAEIGERIEHIGDHLCREYLCGKFPEQNARDKTHRRRNNSHNVRSMLLPYAAARLFFHDANILKGVCRVHDCTVCYIPRAVEKDALPHKIHRDLVHTLDLCKNALEFRRTCRTIKIFQSYFCFHLSSSQRACALLIRSMLATCSSAIEYNTFFPSRRARTMRLSFKIRS